MHISRGITEDMTRGSWIRRMFEEGARLKAQYGEENVQDFTLGNPYVDPPPEFQQALEETAREVRPGIHAYMPNSGFPEVRTRVAEDLRQELGIPFEGRHIVMTVGAAGALNVLLKSLLDPGDEVIVFAPFFPEYAFYIRNHSGVPVVSPAGEDFLPDLEDLDRRLSDRTRAVIVNSPCNPSGRLFPPEVLQGIGDLLRRRSEANGRTIYLLSDEPYRRLLFDGRNYPSPFRHYDATLMAFSHSKSLSLAGERIGFLAIGPACPGADDIFAAATFCNRILGYVNAPALMQRVLLRLRDYQPNVPVYQAKRDRLFQALSEIGYQVRQPEGTFFMFPRSPVTDDLAFLQILARHRVLVTPGTGFAFPGHFRISFAVPDPVIERSFEGFQAAFQEATASRA